MTKETLHNGFSQRSRHAAPMFLGMVYIAAAAIACDPGEEIEMTFVNSTDDLVCLSGSPHATAEDCAEIKPLDVSEWRSGCGRGDLVMQQPVKIVLTLGPGGRVIYERTTTCGHWREASATFIIKERSGEFEVTDSLPEG